MTAVATTLDRRTTRFVPSTLLVVRRAMLRYLRTPQLIVIATIQMSPFFLIYRYMFGGAINAGRIPYVDFLVPGFITTGVLFSGIGAAVAMAEDLEVGFIDRLRSLPIPRSAVLAARAGRGHGHPGVRLHLKRVRAREHDARLAAGLRPAPAAHLHGRRRPGTHTRADRPCPPWPPELVLPDPSGLLGDRDHRRRRGATRRHALPARLAKRGSRLDRLVTGLGCRPPIRPTATRWL
jgi:hypothetical protein